MMRRRRRPDYKIKIGTASTGLTLAAGTTYTNALVKALDSPDVTKDYAECSLASPVTAEVDNNTVIAGYVNCMVIREGVTNPTKQAGMGLMLRVEKYSAQSAPSIYTAYQIGQPASDAEHMSRRSIRGIRQVALAPNSDRQFLKFRLKPTWLNDGAQAELIYENPWSINEGYGILHVSGRLWGWKH